MGFFDFLKGPDIDAGVEEYRATPGAVLLDVRTPEEFRSGHIPGSKNVPLQSLDKVTGFVNNQDTPVFVYCHSGARSSQAVSAMRRMGYSNVKNIGGIAAYSGRVEH
ncbi:MAG: rhodanese-like domain-containing protein [Oscillospiraceae bacterium]|nr:rhodanese-like domain-containing protein [Oscillospiraceae bacterium]